MLFLERNITGLVNADYLILERKRKAKIELLNELMTVS